MRVFLYRYDNKYIDMYALQSLRGVFVITYLISLTLCDTGKYHASSDNVIIQWDMWKHKPAGKSL